MKQIIALLPYFLLLCACHTAPNKEVVITEFPETDSLIASEVNIPEPILLPRFMGIANHKIFVYKEKEEKLFSFFALPDGEYLGSAGTRGQGPDEFGLLDTRSFSTSDENFKVMVAQSNQLKTVAYEDSCLKVLHSEKCFEQGAPNNGFYPLADSIYLTLSNLTDSQEYRLFNKKDYSNIPVGEYPQWTKEYTDNPTARFFAYIKNCVVHPQKNKFAAFYGYFKRLRIYDSSAKLLHDIDVQIAPCHTNFGDAMDTKNRPVYYIGQPQSVGNYIYALCSNASGSGFDAKSDSELHVFDWQGKPVACYKFDRRISLFAICKEHRKIAAIDNRTADKLYIYDLPPIN